MCQPASLLAIKGKILWSEVSDSHEEIIAEFKINQDGLGGPNIVRIEITPPEDGCFAAPLERWRFRVDQDVLPEWYTADTDKYELMARKALVDWVACKVVKGDEVREITDRQVYVCDTAQVTAFGSSKVVAFGRSRVYAHDNSWVEARESADVEVANLACVSARERSTVRAYGNSSVEAFDEVRVVAFGNANVSASGVVRVTANGECKVSEQDSATVIASQEARVIAYHNVVVRASGKSHVAAYHYVAVFLSEAATADVWDDVTVVARSVSNKVSLHSPRCVLVDRSVQYHIRTQVGQKEG